MGLLTIHEFMSHPNDHDPASEHNTALSKRRLSLGVTGTDQGYESTPLGHHLSVIRAGLTCRAALNALQYFLFWAFLSIRTFIGIKTRSGTIEVTPISFIFHSPII